MHFKNVYNISLVVNIYCLIGGSVSSASFVDS